MAPHDAIDRDAITGAVLAGGRGRRMDGADKGLVLLGGKPLVAQVLLRLAPQVGAVVISANRNLDRYAAFGHPVATDAFGDFAGPLAGVHAALARATTRYLVSVPCDAPYFPTDLVVRLAAALGAAPRALAAVARTGAQPQPVFALYDRHAVYPSLETCLQSGSRKVDAWHATLAPVIVDFDDDAAFRNLNTPEELAAAAP